MATPSRTPPPRTPQLRLSPQLRPSPPSGAPRSRPNRLLALGAAWLLGGCLPQAPIGAPFVLLTAELPAGARPFPQLEPVDVGSDPLLALARVVAGASVERLDGAPSHLRLPGAAATFAERLTAEEYETSAYVTAAEFDEPSGLFQGFFHLHDRDSFLAAGSADPVDTAAEGARRFVAEKLPRPMEDPPFVWLHLALRASETAQGAEDRVRAAREALLEVLRPAPDWRLALVRVSPDQGTLLLESPEGEVRLDLEGTEAPESLAELFLAPLGLVPDAEPTETTPEQP